MVGEGIGYLLAGIAILLVILLIISISHYSKALKEKNSHLTYIVTILPFLAVANVTYYCNIKIPSADNFGGVNILFLINSFIIFSLPSLLFIFFRKNRSLIYISVFIFSFTIYNLMFYGEKRDLDKQENVRAIIDSGDISKLKKVVGKDCDSQNTNLNYYFYYSLSTQTQRDVFNFVLDCYLNSYLEIGNKEYSQLDYSQQDDIINFFSERLSYNNKLNSHFELLFIDKYWSRLSENKKEHLIRSLIYNITNKSYSEYKNTYIDRLNFFLQKDSSIVQYININDKDYLPMIMYRDKEAVRFLFDVIPPQSDDLILNAAILSNKLPIVIKMVNDKKDILTNTTINLTYAGFFNSSHIDSIHYSFYVGEQELIDYLINNNLFECSDYNYIREIRDIDVKIAKNTYQRIKDDGKNLNQNHLIDGIKKNKNFKDDIKIDVITKLEKMGCHHSNNQ